MDRKNCKVETELMERTFTNLIQGDCTPDRLVSISGYPEINGTFSVHDPVQGCLGDCYFMAALASVAWAAPSVLKLYALENGKTKYTFFPDTDLSPVVEFTKAVPGNSNNKICYARIPTRPRGVSVMWPLLYEKAYSIYRGASQTDTNWSILNGGAGARSLQEITGWTYVNLGVANWRNIPQSGGKATVPAVAWTDSRALQAGLYQNHTYSFLGFYPSSNPSHVILRNPYGPLKAEPTSNVLTSGIWHDVQPNVIDFSKTGATSDGIFALTTQAFTSSFYGLGYTTAR